MNSVELYMKLKGFWACRTSGGRLMPHPDIKHPGKRWVYKIHNNRKVWYRAKWMPVLAEGCSGWEIESMIRLTYEEFCYALGLEMMP